MIALARKKAGHSPGRELVDFQVADMAGFSLNQTYDLVTSNLDSINHLTGEDDVRKTFGQAYWHLAEGGLFYFDIHSIAGLRSWRYRQNIQDEDFVSFSCATFNEETGIWTSDLIIKMSVMPRRRRRGRLTSARDRTP